MNEMNDWGFSIEECFLDVARGTEEVDRFLCSSGLVQLRRGQKFADEVGRLFERS